MPNRDILRERATSLIEPRFLTHRSRVDTRRASRLTRGPSPGCRCARGITPLPHSSTQRLWATTPRVPTDTRCTSRGSQRASFRSPGTPANSHRASSGTRRPSATTFRPRGTTLCTWRRRSVLRGDTPRPPRGRTRAAADTQHVPPRTSRAPVTRRLPSFRTTRLRRAMCLPRLHTSRAQCVTRRPASHTPLPQFNQHCSRRLTRSPSRLTTVTSFPTRCPYSMP